MFGFYEFAQRFCLTDVVPRIPSLPSPCKQGEAWGRHPISFNRPLYCVTLRASVASPTVGVYISSPRQTIIYQCAYLTRSPRNLMVRPEGRRMCFPAVSRRAAGEGLFPEKGNCRKLTKNTGIDNGALVIYNYKPRMIPPLPD